MELHASQGLWQQRLQQRPALEVVPQMQQDHISLLRFSVGSSEFFELSYSKEA